MDEKALEEILGTAGEDCLRKLTRTGFVVNPAQKDAKGWDFIVEEKNDHDVLAFPLMASRPRVMFVQCKGFAVYPSDQKKSLPKRRQVQMQHWWRSVTDPIPWFYLIVEVNAECDYEPMGAYLVHIGENWIERVSRRALKEIEDEGRLTLEGTMDLRWGPDERLPDLSPSTFNAVIAKYLGDDMDRYALQKTLQRKRAGFEGYAVRLGLPLQSDEKALADYLLGYVPLTTVERYLEERRFGKPRTLMNLGPGPIPSVGASVVVRLESPEDSLRIRGAAYSSSELKELRTDDGLLRFPDHQETIRVVAEPFEAVYVGGKSTIVISAVRPDGHVSLNSALTAHRLMQMFNRPEATSTVHMVIEDGRGQHLSFIDEGMDRALVEARRGLRQIAGLGAALDDDAPGEAVGSMAEHRVRLSFGAVTRRSRSDERVVWLLGARCTQIWEKVAPGTRPPELTCHFGDLLDQKSEIMMLSTLLGIESKALTVTLSSVQKFTLPDAPWIPTVMGLQLGAYRLWAAGFLQTTANVHQSPDGGAYQYSLEHIGGDYVIGKVGPTTTMSAKDLAEAAAHLLSQYTRHHAIIAPEPSMWMATDFPALASENRDEA